MSATNRNQILDEAIGPHLESDEGKDFLIGLATMEDIRSTLRSENPLVAEHFTQLLLKFMWEEISTPEIQAELRKLFDTNESLQTLETMNKFSLFLDATVQSDEEQTAAKRMLSSLVGLVTQKRHSDQSSHEDGMQFQYDVEERFKDQPGKYEEFLRAGFGPWREGISSVRTKEMLTEILGENEDLIVRLDAMMPIRA